MKSKGGVSTVVATVILILLTIVSIIAVSFFVIPFVRDNLGKSGNCIDITDKISIIAEDSCYEPPDTKVKIKAGNIKLDEIYIVLIIGEDSTSYNLKKEENYTDINNNEVIEMPASGGGEKIYSFQNIHASMAKAGVVANNEVCPVSDEVRIEKC